MSETKIDKIKKNIGMIHKGISEVTTVYYRDKYYEKRYADLISQAQVIIQPNEPDYGIFAHVSNICGIIKWAVENGKKPYVDMSAFSNICISDSQIGRVNAWDLYFDQPFKFSDEEIEEIMEYKKAKKIISLGGERYLYKYQGKKKVVVLVRDYQKIKTLRPNDSEEFLTNELAVKYWRSFIHKLIRPKEELKDRVDQLYEELFCSDGHSTEKVLGVLLRGSDYSDNKPKNHPIPPSVKQAIPRIRTIFEEGNYDRIFLATEDTRILGDMKAEFGEVVFYAPQKREGFTNGKVLREMYKDEANNDPYKRGFDYIVAMYLLSKCDGFMGCRTSGAVMAYLLGDHFCDEFFWNLGRYVTEEYPNEFVLL